ncbi:hypothetical protein M9H77_04293 [Catharanthus roseus]|uniref:Uncharacterized protein n=1 Tax=Catharanthus roseus TaxID=4058 RepID=A0ACC0CDV0_CATRO|nr:hypothetical protein M9H77_04293 [Catharanthus roseus]
MEEVPAYVHLGPITPNVFTRQYEHRSGLIWSRDHETCITDLQCRHFGRNLFQADIHPSHRRCREPVPKHGARRVKRDQRRLPHSGTRGALTSLPPGVGFDHGGGRGEGYIIRGRADPESYIPHDPFNSPSGDALTFTLELTPDVPSHPSRAGTSYVPLDPFDSPDVSYVPPSLSVGSMSYALPPPSAIGSYLMHLYLRVQ